MRRQTILLKPGSGSQQWKIVDATDVPLGRLAVEIATVLMGKHRPDFTPHVDCGDWVIVTNAKKVALTGRKAEQKLKLRYTGYPGGLKAQTYGHVREHRPERLVEDAVRRMLPKSRMGRVMLGKLKVYPDTDHPHQSQQPVAMSV